jgi:hypothetical protein
MFQAGSAAAAAGAVGGVAQAISGEGGGGGAVPVDGLVKSDCQRPLGCFGGEADVGLRPLDGVGNDGAVPKEDPVDRGPGQGGLVMVGQVPADGVRAGAQP